MEEKTEDARRQLPAMGALLETPAFKALVSLYGRDLVRTQAQAHLDELRRGLPLDGKATTEDLVGCIDELPGAIERALEDEIGPRLKRVFNATGIFVHTNLGRSPLPSSVVAGIAPLLDSYTDLEFDLRRGRRGDRNRSVEGLLCALTGAPAALLVNNNAASLVLVLATLAAGKEVVVSRGELVEIGGSFRIPSILEAAGAKLREVGATNRVRLSDYESALGPDTALILKVFPSNYRLSGFVSSVEVPSLVELCRRRELPLLVDEGSGLLRPQAPPRPAAPQLQGHSSMRELLSMGSDLVCGSGDKLLGGPQAGILVGEKDLVRRCQRHPLYRALRPDRACVVTMGEILRLHLSDAELPIDRLWASPDQMMPRLLKLQEALGGEIVESDAFVGGGAAPEAAIPGRALALEADDGLTRRLREGDPAVIVFQRTGKMIIDLRTVDPTDDQAFLEAFLGAR